MFKIQVECMYGWFDLKSCSDGESYQTEVFATEIDAENEAKSDFEGTEDNWRVVPVDEPEDWSPYSD